MNLNQIPGLSFLTAAVATSTVFCSDAQTIGQNSSPAQLVDALHTAFGNHHSRAVHAKGIVLEGEFTPDPEASEWTTAFHLQREKTMVIVRFSDFTGIPDIPDNAGGANPRGFAIKFRKSDGNTTDIVGHSFNGFPTPTSDEFRELLLAIGASGPGSTKPTALDSFLSTHPVAKAFLTTQKTPASYGTISYFGVNSFRFINKRGESHYIRYQFIPENGEEILNQEQIAAESADYLQTEIKERIAVGPVRFKMYAQIAEAEDRIEDPSVAWPNSRRLILLGMVEIRKLAPDSKEDDKALSFSPNNIPQGIEVADPMLSFRSKAYPISVKERQ
jgi:catalase